MSFGEYGIGGMLNHRPLNRAKMVTLEAVPSVIENGRVISDVADWKGRGYRSVVFGAPVTIGESTVYVAAVVNQNPEGKFYLSECVDSDGNYIRIENNPSDGTKSGVTAQGGITATPEKLSSVDIIPQATQDVNLRRSLPGDIPADIPPGLRKLYRLAQEMSASPPPREIPQRPVQQSPQEILSQLAREMTMDPRSPLDDLSNEDIRAMLEEIARRQGGEKTSELPDPGQSQPRQSELLSAGEDGTIVPGAISGALNPTGKRARKHAKRYYGLIRKMKTDVARIAKNTGYKADQIQKIKQYLFFDSHILAGGKFERFTPDFDMAQSWKRLLEGTDIKQHDLTLLKHEIMEMALVESGMSQDEAHRKTSAIYNYAKEAEEYNDTIKRYKD